MSNRFQEIFKKAPLALLILLFLGFALPCLAQSQHLEQTGWLDLPANRIEVEGDIAYVSTGNELILLDLALPDQPTEISRIPMTSILRFTVRNGWIYVARGTEGLVIVDARQPENPSIAFNYGDTIGVVRDIDLTQNQAYVVTQDGVRGYLRVIDISDPASPTQLALAQGAPMDRIHYSGGYVYGNSDRSFSIYNIHDLERINLDWTGGANGNTDFELVRPYAYIANEQWGLWVLDVANPQKPVIISNDKSIYSSAIAVEGQFAYLIQNGKASVYNISSPSNPVLCAYFNTGDTANDIAVSHDRIYMTTSFDDGLYILKVTSTEPIVEPEPVPMISGNLDKEGYFVEYPFSPSVMSGDYIISAESNFLKVYRHARPNQLDPLIRKNLHMQIINMLKYNDYIYAVAKNNNQYHLLILNASDPENPFIEHHLPINSSNAMSIGENMLYLLGGSGLQIYDISIPINPTHRGHLEFSGCSGKIVAGSGFVYVTNCGAGFRVIDVQNPDAPKFRGELSTRQNWVWDPKFGWIQLPSTYVTPTDLTIIDQTVYLANGEHGYMAIDISKPDGPKIIGGSQYGDVMAIATDGTRIYIGRNSEYFEILDPNDLSRIAYLDFDKEITTINVYDHFVFSYSAGELNIYDISDPLTPVIDTHRNRIYYVDKISVNDGFAYFNIDDQLQIVDINDIGFPRFRGSCEGLSTVSDMITSGSRTIMAGREIKIIDISNPDDPVPGVCLDLSYTVKAMDMTGSLVIVSGAEDSPVDFQIYEIDDPTTITYRGEIASDPLSTVVNLAVNGKKVYTANGADGFRIFDISQPDTPDMTGSYVTDGDTLDIDIEGQLAYILTSKGLQIFDVSDPSAPVFTGLTRIYGARIIVNDNIAYISGNGMLKVLDVSDPNHPRYTGSIHQYINDIEIDNGFIYATYIHSGAVIIKYNPPKIWLLSQNDDEIYLRREPFQIRWMTEPATAGTAVKFELWNGRGYVADLGADENAMGEGIYDAHWPLNIETGSDYWIRLVSASNPDLDDVSNAVFSIIVSSDLQQNDWLLYE